MVVCVYVMCRQRDAEGRSDTEEDTDGGSESLSIFEEEDNEGGENCYITSIQVICITWICMCGGFDAWRREVGYVKTVLFVFSFSFFPLFCGLFER